MTKRPILLHYLADLHMGGAGQMAAKNIQSLNLCGYKNFVVYFGSNQFLLSKLEACGAYVTHIGHKHRAQYPMTLFRSVMLVLKLKPALLIGNLGFDRRIAAFTARITKTPSITFLHWNSQPVDRESGNLLKKIRSFSFDRLLLRISGTNFMAVSSKIAADWLSSGATLPERIEVIGAGVDTKHFRPPSHREAVQAKKEAGVLDDEHVFIVVARDNPVKNLERTIEAFAGLDPIHHQFKLVLVGSSLDSILRQTALRLGIEESVVLAGEVDDVRRYLWAGDTYVSFSLSEGRPNGLLEAISTGLIPVLSNIPASHEILGDSFPLVADPLSIPDLTQLMRKRLKMGEDEAETLRAEVVKISENFDQEIIGAQLCSSIQRIISATG